MPQSCTTANMMLKDLAYTSITPVLHIIRGEVKMFHNFSRIFVLAASHQLSIV